MKLVVLLEESLLNRRTFSSIAAPPVHCSKASLKIISILIVAKITVASNGFRDWFLQVLGTGFCSYMLLKLWIKLP
ncbi:hypothetical protein P8452_05829 [Trifolium repens]|nr:hypothetical protein P8452_05829 [Trifolium repens]